MQQKKVFTGGLNQDTTDELLPENQDRYRLNVRVLSSDNSTIGAIETVNGNTLIPNVNLPTGTNTVFGSKEYLIWKKVYFFVYNSLGSHCIFEYTTDTNTIAIVLKEGVAATQVSGLNFNSSYLINSINFIELDADNHLMYWTDNYNPPRKLNIEKAKYFSTGNHTLGYKTPFDINWIARIKMPPQQPICAWSNDATRVVNFLFNKNFQFKAQYVYDDREVSAFSSISNYEFPEVTYVANNADDIYTQDNLISVTIDTGSSIVTKIRIAAKEVNETDFVQIAEINKSELGLSDNSNFTYAFYNDGAYVPIEINESIKLYDNVPKLCATHDLIAGNRIADGNVTEGYNPVDIDFQLNLGFQSVDNSGPNPGPITTASYLKSGGRYVYGIVYYDEFNRSGVTNIQRGDYNVLNNAGIYGTTLRIPFFTETGYLPIAPALTAQMNSAPLVTWDVFNPPPSWAKKYRIVRSQNTAYKKYIQFVLKTIEYYDANGVVINPTVFTPYGFRFSVRNITDEYKHFYPLSRLTYDYTVGDRVRFIARPPYTDVPVGYGGAAGWDFGGSTSSTYGSLPDLVNLPFNDYEISGWDSTNRIVSVTIKESAPLALADVYYPGTLYEIYTPGLVVEDDLNITYEFGETYDITTDSFGNLVHAGDAGGSNQIIVASASNTLVPPTIVNDPMVVPSGHGIIAGDKVKVVQSTGSFYADVISAAATTINVTASSSITGIINSGVIASTVYKSANGTFFTGDSFRPYQDMVYTILATSISGIGAGTYFHWYSHVENMDINNFFNSEQWDYRRPNRVDPDFKEVNRKATIVYSESFIPETNINGLSSVYDTNFESYNDKFGQISKLYTENQGVIMFQELKIANIPVQQVIYNDLQGGTTVGASPSILSPQPIYYAGEYGIGKNPESFAVYGNAKYGIDVKRGVVWRLSVDGLTPISDTAFMHNYFTDKSYQILRVSTPVKIFGGFDVKFNEYIIAFDAYTYYNGAASIAVGAETIAFNERANAWSTFYSYNPETICSNGTDIVTFKAGNIYTHNTNVLQGNFYNSIGYAQFWSVLNANPSNVKVFEALSEETLDAWEVYSITNADGQSSSLEITDFQEIENLQYAPLWKDANTPNLTAGTALFEGDPMRSTTFLCKFRRTTTAYNKIFAVNFKYIISNLHNR